MTRTDMNIVQDCAVCAPLESLSPKARKALITRAAATSVVHGETRSVHEETRRIVADVRSRGDVALRELARRFDGVDIEQLEVPQREWVRAFDALPDTLRSALERAAHNIDVVHRAMMPVATRVSPEPGIVICRRPDPLGRVGVYAPGGRAAYPSSLLMGAVPARVAGVGEVVVCSPPAANGLPLPVVLAAARIARVDRVFAIGGAGAIAAMACGTDAVPRVDRIVGPGNAYVAEAKLQLVGDVAIDAPAGPSELLILADDRADASRIAHELMAQAEHDPDAAVVALIVGARAATLSSKVAAELARLLSLAPRGTIAREALAQRGALLTTASLDAAIAFTNDFAAEHLLVMVDSTEQATEIVGAVRNTGTVFIGDGASVAFGDYLTGANHVLPTAGLARAYSGLSTLDFFRWTTWQEVDANAARSLAPDTALLAEAEGLPAHATAALRAAEVGAS